MTLIGGATLSAATPGTHNLSVPLQRVRPAFVQPQEVAESWDKSLREVYNIGSGVYEILATIRYEEDPETTIEIIKAGLRGETLTYADPDKGIANLQLLLIAPAGEAVVTREAEPWGSALLWGTVEVRLRKTDGTAFPAALFD